MQRPLHLSFHYLNLPLFALEDTSHSPRFGFPEPQELTFRKRINPLNLFGSPHEHILDNQQEGEEEGQANDAK